VIVLLLLTSFGAIVYFNLPANYFRAMDRHYLPSFALFGVLIVYGAGSLLSLASRNLRSAAVIGVVLLAAVGGLAQVARNWSSLDNSRSFFAYDCGQNLLQSVPARGILITGTDVDTYPVWYLQMIEKTRPDVTVANVNLANTSWYLTQILASQEGLPFTMTEDEIAAFGFRKWRDTVLAVPIHRDVAENAPPDVADAPDDTLHLRVPPTVQGQYIHGHDDFLIRLIVANQGRRPILFTSFALPQVGWLQPYLRPEGLVSRLMPFTNPPPDTTLLINNLFRNCACRGYNDLQIVIEPPSRWVAQAAYSAFLTLATGIADSSRCEELRTQMAARIPLARIDAPQELVSKLQTVCARQQPESR